MSASVDYEEEDIRRFVLIDAASGWAWGLFTPAQLNVALERFARVGKHVGHDLTLLPVHYPVWD